MTDCRTCWQRYMTLMTASRDGTRDARHRRTLIREAFGWLDAYFEAVEREIGRDVRAPTGQAAARRLG
jgi:hypothetical protein